MTGHADAIMVGLGQAVVASTSGTLGVLGLGSCVAVVLHDAATPLGGLVHVVLPSASLSRDRSNPARFAETAVPHLIESMIEAGARRERLTARLVGGAAMFANLIPPGSSHMGQRNVIACRAALRAAGIQVAGEAVGGELGRSAWLEVDTGRLTFRTVGHAPETL